MASPAIPPSVPGPTSYLAVQASIQAQVNALISKATGR